MKPRWIRYTVRSGFFVLTALVLPLFRNAYDSMPVVGNLLIYSTVYGILYALILYLGIFLIPRILLRCKTEYNVDAISENDYKRQYEFLASLDEKGKRELGARITTLADKLGASDRAIAVYSRSRKLSSHTIYKYMIGNWTDFHLSDIYSIASVLNVTPDELLCPESEPTSKVEIDASPNAENMPTDTKPKENVYILEAANGMTVRVPESQLDAWLKGQEEIRQGKYHPSQERIDSLRSQLENLAVSAPTPRPKASVTLKRYVEPQPAQPDTKPASWRHQKKNGHNRSTSAIIWSILITIAVIGFVACLCVVLSPKSSEDFSTPSEQIQPQSASAFFTLFSEIWYTDYYNNCYVEFIGDPTYEMQTLSLSKEDADATAAERSVSCSVTSAMARTRLDLTEGTYLIRFTLRHQNDFTQEPLIYRSEEEIYISSGDYYFDLITCGLSEHINVKYNCPNGDDCHIKLLRIYKYK